MLRIPVLVFAGALVVSPIAADVLPFDTLSRRVYLLRTATVASSSSGWLDDRALWSYDPVEKRFERITPFRHRDDIHPLGRVDLSGSEDRIILQGSEVMELDAVTGRLLRRYQGLRDARGWVFSGALVTETVASRLGIEPGTYGFFRCPENSSTTGRGCSGPPPLPDTTQPVTDEELHSRLYRRPLDPRRPDLELVHLFGTDPSTTNTARRFIAADPDEGRFLVWSTKLMSTIVAPVAHDLTSLAIGRGGAFEETPILREIDSDTRHYHSSDDFTFVPRLRAVFHLMSRVAPAWAYLFTVRPLSTLIAEPVDVIESSQFARGQTVLNDRVTGLLGTLPESYEQLIPIVGDAPGANGTHWRSDLWLFNPDEQPVTVNLRRVARPASTKSVAIPAHGSVAFSNVLRELGGGPVEAGGDGVALDAIVLTAPYRWGAQVSAYSRAYTDSTAPGEEGGTFGQAVPAVPTSLGYTNHVDNFAEPIDALLSTPSHLILDRENPGQFRHNLGVVNDSDQPIKVRLRGQQVEKSFTVAPHSVANANLEELFPDKVERLTIAADQPAAIWLSMIDNRTGDATFIPFSLFGLRGVPDSFHAVPGVARTRGANGTWWWTDLYGEFRTVFIGDVHHSPRARLRTAGCDGEETHLVGGGHLFRDVVRLAGCQGEDRLGALELRTSSWTAGFTRTYTTRGDGGTYGEMLPFYPHRGWPIQHFGGVQLSEQFRVNVGLYNGMDRPVLHTFRLYRQDGSLAHESQATLAAHESRQGPLASWIGAPMAHGIYGLTVVPQDEPGSPGRSWAYVSIVDNVTNDPTNWW